MELSNNIETTGAIERLTKDVREAAKNLPDQEARFLVDLYYQLQDNRIRAGNQEFSMTETNEPHKVLSWFSDQQEKLELRCKQALQVYAESHPVGQWMLDIRGLGPVIAAGLLCRSNAFDKANHVAQIWSYAGLTPEKVGRKRGEKLNHDPGMKRILWLLGESFVKHQKVDNNDFYGVLMARRKQYEHQENLAGNYKEQAEKALRDKKIGKETVAYASYSVGKLPDGHIHARAKRWTVKIFLSHLFEIYKLHHGEIAPRPYVVAILGHADYMAPPGLEEFKESLKLHSS